MRQPERLARLLAARARQRRESQQGGVEEPGEPDALTRATHPDSVHAVVPIPGAYERQAVHTVLQALIERQRAVLEQRCALVRDRGHEEYVVLLGPQYGALQERHLDVQYGRLAGALDVRRTGIGEPDPIISDAGAHALPGVAGHHRGQPPVLDVALRELAGRRAQQLCAREGRSRDQ